MSSLLDRLERQATILSGYDETIRREARAHDLETIARLEERRWKSVQDSIRASGDPTAAEYGNYVDSIPPFNSADFASVTLSTTSKEMWPTALWTSTPSGGRYWWPGKTMTIIAFGKFTTAATPGNLTVEFRYGVGDAGGTILATSAAMTLVASQTLKSWRIEMNIECRAIGTGSNGSLFAWGKLECSAALIAAGGGIIPENSGVAVGVDTTAASGLSLQFKRSGSTAEIATTQDLQFMSRN